VRRGVVPDVNLDSDRGYGWLQWRAPISPGVGTLDENLPDRGMKVGEEVTVSAAGRRRWPDEKEKPADEKTKPPDEKKKPAPSKPEKPPSKQK